MNQLTLPLSLSFQKRIAIFLILSFSAFAVPFSLGHPQMVVGTIVNASLFSSALFLTPPFILPIVFFPSLAVLCRGIIFGPLTPFLFYLIPFIWLGNWFLVNIFKKIFNLSLNYWLSAGTAVLIKFIFLYFSAFCLFKIKLIPRPFLTTMGVFQLITALLGALIAFFVKFSYDRFTRT